MNQTLREAGRSRALAPILDFSDIPVNIGGIQMVLRACVTVCAQLGEGSVADAPEGHLYSKFWARVLCLSVDGKTAIDVDYGRIQEFSGYAETISDLALQSLTVPYSEKFSECAGEPVNVTLGSQFSFLTVGTDNQEFGSVFDDLQVGQSLADISNSLSIKDSENTDSSKIREREFVNNVLKLCVAFNAIGYGSSAIELEEKNSVYGGSFVQNSSILTEKIISDKDSKSVSFSDPLSNRGMYLGRMPDLDDSALDDPELHVRMAGVAQHPIRGFERDGETDKTSTDFEYDTGHDLQNLRFSEQPSMRVSACLITDVLGRF